MLTMPFTHPVVIHIEGDQLPHGSEAGWDRTGKSVASQFHAVETLEFRELLVREGSLQIVESRLKVLQVLKVAELVWDGAHQVVGQQRN